MRTARAVLTATAVWVTVTTALTAIALDLPAEVLERPSGRLTWFAFPQAFTSFAMVVLGALAYWRRDVPLRPAFAAAVLAVPVAQLLGVTVLGAFSGGGALLVAARCAAGVLGGALGWWGVRRFGPTRR